MGVASSCFGVFVHFNARTALVFLAGAYAPFCRSMDPCGTRPWPTLGSRSSPLYDAEKFCRQGEL